jgi:DHA1 family tetracycline resistance protein-like MFS transporter
MKNNVYLPIWATAVIDGMGMGLVMPIFPDLLRQVGEDASFGWRFGLFLSIYSLMQFVCAPLMGSLGDRFGRRPVLLASLAGITIDYLFMAVAPSFWLLLIGRAISGAAGASISVLSATVADITPEQERARRFGQLSAAMGVGFIAGPAIGGVLGDSWVRAPFIAAAALGLINLAMAIVLLPESRPAAAEVDHSEALNPFAPLRWLRGFPSLGPMMMCYAIVALVGQIGGTIWVLYGQDHFHWDVKMVGLSLACFGFFHALAQSFVVGPITERFGERAALLIGVISDGAAYVLIAMAGMGWMAFALMPLFCIGGIAAPALQSLLSNRVGADFQGRLQGVLASVASLASVGGPLLISPLYVASRATMPGLAWIVGASLYLLCLPVFLAQQRISGPQPSSQ